MSTLEAPFRVAFRGGRDQRAVLLESQRHFRFYPLRAELSELLPAPLIDLIRLGLAVHAVDGLVPRTRAGDGYRDIEMELEVLAPAFWRQSDTASILKECLDFVGGGDNWQISFVPDRRVRHEHRPGLAFRDKTVVCMYSSGLDSAAGLAARLKDRSGQVFVPVNVRYQFTCGRRARNQLEILRRRYGLKPWELLPFSAAAFVRGKRLHRDLGLRTQNSKHRCRSFSYLVVGGAVANIEGADAVEIYESGIGAVNLPLLPRLAGWRTSRNSHPHFLRMMSRLLSLVTERPITFRLPFRDRTKVEMARVLVGEGLEELARSTVSCVAHPLHRGKKQCGVCSACVFRRHALQVAGIEELGHSYCYDIFGSSEMFDSIHERGLRALKLFLVQASQLSEELERGASSLRSFVRHTIYTQVLDKGENLAGVTDLFRRYGEEWKCLISLGPSRGWPWTDSFAPAEHIKQGGLSHA